MWFLRRYCNISQLSILNIFLLWWKFFNYWSTSKKLLMTILHLCLAYNFLQVHSRSIPATGPFKEYSSSRSIQGIFQPSFVTIHLFQRKRSYSFSHRVFCWTKPCDCDNLGILIATNNVAYLDSSYNKSHRNNKKNRFGCLWLLALFEPSLSCSYFL